MTSGQVETCVCLCVVSERRESAEGAAADLRAAQRRTTSRNFDVLVCVWSDWSVKAFRLTPVWSVDKSDVRKTKRVFFIIFFPSEIVATGGAKNSGTEPRMLLIYCGENGGNLLLSLWSHCIIRS